MTNAAWAFVRPTEITKGALAAIELENKQAANDIALAEARAAMAQNAELRPLQIQSAQLGLQSAGLGLQNLQNATATNTENFQNNQWATAARKALQVDQAPGESELSIYKKQLTNITSIDNPEIKYQGVKMLDESAKQLGLSALNRGDLTSVQAIASLRGNPITIEELQKLTPVQQVNFITGNTVTGSLPTPKVAEAAAIDNYKTMNDIRLREAQGKIDAGLRAVPSADSQNKLVMDQANRDAPITMYQGAQLYSAYLVEATKNGITPMPFAQYMAQYSRSNAGAPVNSVTGPRDSIGSGGVPFK